MSSALPLIAETESGLFGALKPQDPDALLALIGAYRRDPREGKIDLGVGVYRDDRGDTPVLRAVKAAERRLVAEQPTKAYLGAEGDIRFVDLLAPIVFGEERSDNLTGVQTPGGTGALRLAAELVARARPNARVWLGTPTWPNHAPIFREAGLAVRMHAFFDAAAGAIDFPAMMADLAEAQAGDVLVLHGCCHNPTGADLSAEQWRAVIADIAARGIIPLIDLAYQGLGDGLEADAAGMRAALSAVPEAMVAYSCDKNFGLYRERVGALWVQAAGDAAVRAARDNMLVLARSLWSMPPDHGAATVRLILDDPILAADWRVELGEMRVRMGELRTLLGDSDPRLARFGKQRGMFGMLPIDADAVAALRDQHGIYIASGARINIAGLRTDTVETLVKAVRPYLR